MFKVKVFNEFGRSVSVFEYNSPAVVFHFTPEYSSQIPLIIKDVDVLEWEIKDGTITMACTPEMITFQTITYGAHSSMLTTKVANSRETMSSLRVALIEWKRVAKI